MEDVACTLVEFKAPGKRARRDELYRVVQKGPINLVLEMRSPDAMGVPSWVGAPYSDVLTEYFQWSKRWGASWKACATHLGEGQYMLNTTSQGFPRPYCGVVVCVATSEDRREDDHDQYVYKITEAIGLDYISKVPHLAVCSSSDTVYINFAALVMLALHEQSLKEKICAE